jgi:ubiquitin-protein ligase
MTTVIASNIKDQDDIKEVTERLNIKLETIINNKYVFNINDYYIIFTYNSERKYYIVSSDITMSFFDTINIYSIQKKPTLNTIIERVYNDITKLNKKKNTKINIKNNIAELEEEKTRLRKLISSSISKINIECTIKKTFDKTTVQDLIINEYIKLYQNKDKKYNINISDNIYVWTIDYDNIIMELMFHSIYYPNYPIQVVIKSPIYSNSLNNRISNLKLFQLEYWDPITSVDFIINRVHDIIKKHGCELYKNNYKLDNMSSADSSTVTTQKKDNNINYEMKSILDGLNLYINNLDDIIDEEYEYVKFINFTKKQEINKTITKKTTKQDKFNGTGYTGSNNSKWSIKEYEELMTKKRIQLENTIRNIYCYLLSNRLEEEQLKNTINQSLLIKFLTLELRTSILEMNNKQELYKLYLNIIQYLCCNNFNLECLKSQFDTLYDEANTTIKFDKTNEIATLLIIIHSMINDKIKTEKKVLPSSSLTTSSNSQNEYISILKPLKFTQIDLLNTGLYNLDYKKLAMSTKPTSGCLKRISTEIPSLVSNLPINVDASIFLIIDENNPRAMRAMITGPPDTPYDSCCYIFDIYLPPDYPIEGPKVKLLNTNGNRINPNLYQCGKVCLSILGTYVGPTTSQTERWNSQSTLYQVLISIQSQILVEEPYFNEPGFQCQYKTQVGDIESKKYNTNVVGYTLNMMNILIDNPNTYGCFSEQINQHFKINKEKIIQIVTNFALKYTTYQKISEEIINKLC